MNHALPVGIVERSSRFARNAHGLDDRQLPLAANAIAQALAGDERHREPELAVGLAGIVNAEDVRMLQASRQPDLLLEAIGSEGRRDFRVKDLQRHRTVVTTVLREIDRRKPAAPELTVNRVLLGQVRQAVALGHWDEAYCTTCSGVS